MKDVASSLQSCRSRRLPGRSQTKAGELALTSKFAIRNPQSEINQSRAPSVRAIFCLLAIVGSLLVNCQLAEAHIGSPNVFFEGRAGEYSLRVVIRPPQVVPGLAEISVRVENGPADHLTVLPVFWSTGRKGSPPPDEAKLVRGNTNLYTAALWLMKSGAYSVEVNVDGPRGKGTLVVPVNSIATNTKPMTPAYRAVLLGLGALLFVWGLNLAGVLARESRLEPGVLPTRRDIWRGRAAIGAGAVALCLLAFGGKKWWDYEDRNYRNNSLYRPLPVLAEVREAGEEHVLSLTVDTKERRGQWTPLIPDHGKLMHLFLIHEGEAGAFAHLHPLQKSKTVFEAPLPPLPAGTYHVYADVTHEDGFAETLTAIADVPPSSVVMKRLWLGNSTEPICSEIVAQMLSTNLVFAPDVDDSWHVGRAASAAGQAASGNSKAVANLSGGYKVIWENPDSVAQNAEDTLRFKFVAPDGQLATIEPFMGMAGHAMVWRPNGEVFAHIHPAGTISMAAQEFFVNGAPPKRSAKAKTGASLLEARAIAAEEHYSHTNAVSIPGELSFPYEFPRPGSYRVWVQARSQGRVLTGAFETVVAGK